MDYAALAAQYGGKSASAPDYAALATQYGGKSNSDNLTLPVTTIHGNDPSYMDSVKANVASSGQAFNQLLMGGLRGAAGIGATLQHALNPMEWGNAQADSDRRASINDFFQSNTDPTSVPFQAGKLGAEVAGTAGVGGAIAAPLRAAAPVLGPLANAIGSSGFSTGVRAAGIGGNALNAATRVAGGAITGGASAAAIDPDSAGAGAIIGGALPPALKVAGLAGKIVTAVPRAIFGKAAPAGAAADLAKALDATTPADQANLLGQLQSAPTLVPGASPTVAQALQTPQAGILQRVVYDSPGGNALRAKIAQQGEARSAALENVAPIGATGSSEAKNDLGNAIASRVIPEEAGISGHINDLYNAVDPYGVASLSLPTGGMTTAVNRFVGPGTIGQGATARNALAEASGISQNGNATWAETQRLRSSIGDAITEAQARGNNQEAAALAAQKAAIDSTVTRASGGNLYPGENFTPDMADAWSSANAAHAAKMDRFHTGPQASIFRTGSSGEPAVQGGEIASKFWGARPGAADDVQAFRRLVDDNPAMLGQFKSMVTTEGAGTADAAGNLTTKYSRWVGQNLPGLREAFDPGETQALQNIAQDIDRHAAAVKSGTSLGGSNTYQNASNALSLGLLDSPILDKAAGVFPGMKYIAGPVLAGMRNAARTTKANQLASLLSDSSNAANALQAMIQQRPQNALARPRLLYRAAPVLGANQD